MNLLGEQWQRSHWQHERAPFPHCRMDLRVRRFQGAQKRLRRRPLVLAAQGQLGDPVLVHVELPIGHAPQVSRLEILAAQPGGGQTARGEQ